MRQKLILVLNALWVVAIALTELNVLSLVDSEVIKSVLALLMGFLNGKFVDFGSLLRIGGGGIKPPKK